MDDNLRSMPAEKRPRMIPLLPRGWRYLCAGHSGRWLTLLLLPILASVVTAWMRGMGTLFSAGIAVFGLAVSTLIVVNYHSGMSSCNHGTFFRGLEPWRYWCGLGILVVFYVLVCCLPLLAGNE